MGNLIPRTRSTTCAKRFRALAITPLLAACGTAPVIASLPAGPDPRVAATCVEAQLAASERGLSLAEDRARGLVLLRADGGERAEAASRRFEVAFSPGRADVMRVGGTRMEQERVVERLRYALAGCPA